MKITLNGKKGRTLTLEVGVSLSEKEAKWLENIEDVTIACSEEQAIDRSLSHDNICKEKGEWSTYTSGEGVRQNYDCNCGWTYNRLYKSMPFNKGD